MNYPIVYDRFETLFHGFGLAVLEQANNVKVHEVINGEFLLSFILPRTDPKWEYIQPDNLVKVYNGSQGKDQLFRIRTFEEQRDNTGKLTSNIQCEHVWYDANDCKHIPYYEAIGKTPAQIMEEAFDGTPFSVGTVEITTPTDIWLDKTTPSEIVMKLVENVGGELVKDNWTISLVEKRGNETGVQFRIGKNISSIKRYTDDRDVITRLYPYGKDGLEIYSVNGGKPYIDSPLYDSRRPRVGYKDYKDIEGPEELLGRAQAEFSTADFDGIDKPKVTYTVDVVELKKLKEFGDYEAFGIGDTIGVFDDGLGINTKQRIVEYDEYPYEALKSKVGLANYSPKEYRKQAIGTFLGSLEVGRRHVEKITTGAGAVKADWLEQVKSKLRTTFNSALHEAVMLNRGHIWVDDINNPTKAIGIIADGFAIANNKLSNGDWNWKTFGTAEGFTAELINTGILNCSLVSVRSDTGNLEITNNTIIIKDTNDVVREVIGEIIPAAGTTPAVYGHRIYDAAGNIMLDVSDAGKLLFKGIIETVEDITIGKKLNMNPDAFGGIIWGSYANIYVDPSAGGSLNLESPYINLHGHGTLNFSDIATQDDIENVKAWVQLNYAQIGHTHT